MEEIPMLAHLRANYEIVKEVDNDVEIEVTTFAHVQPDTAVQLTRAGWVQRAPNVFAYLKPRYEEEIDVGFPDKPTY